MWFERLFSPTSNAVRRPSDSSFYFSRTNGQWPPLDHIPAAYHRPWAAADVSRRAFLQFQSTPFGRTVRLRVSRCKIFTTSSTTGMHLLVQPPWALCVYIVDSHTLSRSLISDVRRVVREQIIRHGAQTTRYITELWPTIHLHFLGNIKASHCPGAVSLPTPPLCTWWQTTSSLSSLPSIRTALCTFLFFFCI